MNLLFKSKKKMEISSPRGFRHTSSFVFPQPQDRDLGQKKSFTFSGHTGKKENEGTTTEANNDDVNCNINYTQDLPLELLAQIFSFLPDPIDLCCVARTCHKWRAVCMLYQEHSDRVWSAMFQNFFGFRNETNKKKSWKDRFIEEYKVKLPLKDNFVIDTLRKAAVNGDLETIKAVARRYNVDHPLDSDGYTLLHYACIHGHTSLVHYLLKSKLIPVNKRVEEVYRHGTGDTGDTALHFACQHGRTDIGKQCIEHFFKDLKTVFQNSKIIM